MKQMHHRLDVLQTILEQNQHDLKGRTMDGIHDIKLILGKMEQCEPETLSLELKKHLDEQNKATLGQLKAFALGCIIALGLMASSLGLLWMGQRSIQKQIKQRIPSPHQLEMMLKGWELQKEDTHVQ